MAGNDQFKMQMRAGRIAGAAFVADHLTLAYLLAGLDGKRDEMGIVGLAPVPVVNLDEVAVTVGRPGGIIYPATLGRQHRRTGFGGNINPRMSSRKISGYNAPDRPDQRLTGRR